MLRVKHPSADADRAHLEHRMRGQCHCGAIGAELVSLKAAAELQLRSCQCSFCARHGAMTVSDPQGRATLTVDAGALVSYAFATRSGRILLCGRCGVYVGMILEEDGAAWAVLNARGLAIAEFAGRSGDPVVYEGETAQRRRARRKAMWTPAEIVHVQR
jgi:hypothetical protein